MRLVHSMILLAGWLVALPRVAASLSDVDFYTPYLPTYIAIDEQLDHLEIRLYNLSNDTAQQVRVTPVCPSIVFTPSFAIFNATTKVHEFVLKAIVNGTWNIDYVAKLEGDNANTEDESEAVLSSQQIHILAQPLSFEVTDDEWHGVILQNDSFDLPFEIEYPSSLWNQQMHGYPSGACGAFDGERALYFTSLGDRFAVTTSLDLLGFHGKMHFYHIYGFRDGQDYDTNGDNRISCERVDVGEEIEFSFLPAGENPLNESAWQLLYEVPLPLMDNTDGVFTDYSVPLPVLAMHTNAQFRWRQKNHSSFPIDLPAGMTREEIYFAENDPTSSHGGLGRNEQELWHYRNLFDQWALDDIRLEVGLNAPGFTSTSNTTLGVTNIMIFSTVPNSWVKFTTGDGTQSFPVCERAQIPNGAQAAIASLSRSSYIHAVACLADDSFLISSFPVRSPQFHVQASKPTISSTLNSSSSVDTWNVQLDCTLCDFMRYSILPVSTTATGIDKSLAPSCSYGLLVNATSKIVLVTSNAKIAVVACGHQLVRSDVILSDAFIVHPRKPAFAYDYPSTTITGQVSVTIIAPDRSGIGVTYSIGADAAIPTCVGEVSTQGEITMSIKVNDVVRAVACCFDKVCADSKVATWGPLSVRVVAPVITTACSRTKPLTKIVNITAVTINASIRYHVGVLSSSLTCLTGTKYENPVALSMQSDSVIAISCLDGLEPSDQVEATVQVEDCCSGLDAYQYPSCSHVLLLHDNFSECLDSTKWVPLTSQWGGDDVNGGVHSINVNCVNDADTKKTMLALEAHGDLFHGSEPIGHFLASDGTLKARERDDQFLEWGLDGVSPLPCNQLERCPARRVGAAISTTLLLNAGVFIMHVKPCDAFGTLTQVWWGKYEDREAIIRQELPFLPLWKAGLYQSKTTSRVPYTLSSPSSSTFDYTSANVVASDFIEVTMQWNATDGRANLYVNGQLVFKQSIPEVSSTTNSTLSIGVWFPNAMAGEPFFESCQMYVDDVRILKSEVADDRWCDFEYVNANPIACESDADCLEWVNENCLMGIFEAICITHLHDSLEVLYNDSYKSTISRFCQFRMYPSAQTSVSLTEMTARAQNLVWGVEE